MSRPIRALLFGLGPIGCSIGRLAAERQDIALVGGVDSAPDKAGRPLYDVIGADAGSGANPAVEPDGERALANTKPQVVLHATGSFLPDVLPQLLACAHAGANVVSTCEELSYPWLRRPELSKELDEAAKANGVTVLGTGINPGFVLDTLAACVTTVCQRVDRVRLKRLVDVSTRRPQLQRKVGVGLSLDEFRERASAGRFGHVGTKESCWLVAAALGWQLDSLNETIEPVPGPEGRAAGIRQTAIGTLAGRPVIEALVQMSTDVDQPRDEIQIDGTPPVSLAIEGGVPGDTATAAVILNSVPRVVGHQPGLATMLDLPITSGRGVKP